MDDISIELKAGKQTAEEANNNTREIMVEKKNLEQVWKVGGMD